MGATSKSKAKPGTTSKIIEQQLGPERVQQMKDAGTWDDYVAKYSTDEEKEIKTAETDKAGAEAAASLAPPDMTSDALRRARSAQMLRTLTGQGRRSTFLTGALGDPTNPVVKKKTLLGGG